MIPQRHTEACMTIKKHNIHGLKLSYGMSTVVTCMVEKQLKTMWNLQILDKIPIPSNMKINCVLKMSYLQKKILIIKT